MHKLIKIVGIAAAAVVVLALLAILAASWLFNPNDYKSYLETWVAQTTGRSLRIEDDLELSYFPWLAIQTGRLTLGNAPGFEAVPFATARRAAARVRLLPLLQQRVEIGTVEIDGLALNLARDAALRGNWEDLRPDAAEQTASGSAATAGELDIAGLRISDSSIAWYENTDSLRYQIDALALTTGPIRPDAATQLSLAMQVTDVLAQQGLQIELEARAALPEPGTVAIDALDARFELRGPASATGQGRVRVGTLRSTADGAVSAESGQLDLDFPEVIVAQAPLSVAASWQTLRYETTTAALRIDGLEATSRGLASTWTITATDLTGNSRLGGTVRLAQQPLAAALTIAELALPDGVTADELGRFDLNTDFEIDPQGQRIALPNLTAALLGLRLDAAATLEERMLQVRLQVPRAAPTAPLRAVLSAYTPEGTNIAALDELGFAADLEIDLDTGNLAARNIDAALLGANLRGRFDSRSGTGGRQFQGSLTTSRFEPDRLAAALGPLLPEGITPAELGTLMLDTDFSYDPQPDLLSLTRLSTEVFGLSATGALTGRSVGTRPNWTGSLAVARFSPRELMRRFGQAVPLTADTGVLTAATVSTRVTLDADRGQFDDIVLKLDDSSITGRFSVDNFQNPRYGFGLAIDRVDVDRYLPPPAEQTDPAAATPSAGDIELPSEALNTLVLNGQAQVDELGLAGMRFANVATAIELGEGRAALRDASADLYGGHFDGSLSVDTAAGASSLALTGRATALALAPLIQDLFGEPASISATGAFDLALSGTGRTVLENVAAAAGNLSFTLTDGSIAGFNLGATLCRVYNATQKLPRPADAPAVTRFETIRGTAQVKGGVASTSDLLARAAFMDVTGAGQLTLATQHLNYAVDAKLTGPIDIAGCESMQSLVGQSIPVKLEGTVSAPEITPDFSKLIEQRLRQEVQERLEDRLLDLLRR